MRAWTVDSPAPIDEGPLRQVEREPPEPGEHEVRIRVSVCGVCRTDLHVAEGDLPPHRIGVVPGHEIVGLVDAVGPGATRFELGQRIGIAWLRWTCGTCRFCLRGDENLCVAPRFTGWDDDGGFAEYATVHEDYGYVLPAGIPDEEAAPLLCAGIIGYRALRRSNLRSGGSLGIYGFGASAHLAAQVAMSEGATVHVVTRSAEARQLALDLGVASAQQGEPPEPLDAAILFAPVGTLVPPALAALDRGGTLSVAGIYLTDVPPLSYQTHLFEERGLVSVTANTRRDGEALLALASEIPIRVITTRYRLDEAPRALSDLAGDRVSGAAVLDCRSPAPAG
ncbi:MAG TPA: zinc-dependent alcohol dehydrogenase family protein [Acidimicrobiales bacterium]|nr:zinc-dependent alcohol dehydrogenase family protein [Acidimicrobiales bacterium]